MPRIYNTIIIGAGAAGMMCAAHTGGQTLVIDHAKNPGEKIRISGGGRCNFTNIHTEASNFISQNPHFAKSALKSYTQHDFIAHVERHNIAYHEKTLGQLFCDNSAKQIIQLLQKDMQNADAHLQLETRITEISKTESGFQLTLEKHGKNEILTCRNVVVACGGKSIPKMGATGFGYQIAEQFGHTLTDIRPALVPLTFDGDILETAKTLAGVAIDAKVTTDKTSFNEALLFTHRGLSGPAILQISSYWREKQPIEVALLPSHDCLDLLRRERTRSGKRAIHKVLAEFLPKSIAAQIAKRTQLTGNLADQSDAKLQRLAAAINHWKLYPIGTEGYRTAEVTLGGVDTDGLLSKTMQSKSVPGLYFIGEVVDVTGWLGGYNFQWAWSSGYAAGTAIASDITTAPR
ncbi:MAG: NAD(P)/FAD-dependent oxidoreductase [Hyphomicrobiales bacterium]